MHKDCERILISEAEINAMVKGIAAKINEDYKGKSILLVGLLKGSVVFMADLMRAITIPARIGFMSVSS